MSVWETVGKLMAFYAQYGDRINKTLDVWLVDEKPKTADEAREVVRREMTPGERASFNRDHNIHTRED